MAEPGSLSPPFMPKEGKEEKEKKKGSKETNCKISSCCGLLIQVSLLLVKREKNKYQLQELISILLGSMARTWDKDIYDTYTVT